MPLISRITLAQQDVSLIYEELHQSGRSVLPYPSPSASKTPASADKLAEPFYPFSAHPIALRPALVRWDLSRELSVTNCVVLEQKDAERHLQLCGVEGKTHEEVWGTEVEKGVRELMALAGRVLTWREKEA